MTDKFKNFIKTNDKRINSFANRIANFKINGVNISFLNAKERTINWLRNFDNLDFIDFELPLQLLEKIEFITSQEISEKLNKKAEYLLSNPNSYIAPLGEQSESSFRIVSQHNRSERFFISIQNLLDNIPESGDNKILLFDDFLNSGGQVITIFKRLLGIPFTDGEINDEGEGRPELNKEQKQKLLNSEIHLFYYKGFDEGVESLEVKNVSNLNLKIKIHRYSSANDTDGAFGDSDDQVKIEHELVGVLNRNCSFMGKEFKDLSKLYIALKKAGEELLKVNQPKWSADKNRQMCLGYGNKCRVIITEFNVPTTTLTALWLSGEVEMSRKKFIWHELLPREKKVLRKNNSLNKEKITSEIQNKYEKKTGETQIENAITIPTIITTEKKASVIAVRNFHDHKNLEEYLSEFEEATGFEDYVVELKGSRYHPKNIIQEIRTNFDFLGHGASKWTNEFEILNKAIERIKRNMGLSRFLIFDPRNAVGLEDHGDKSEDIHEQMKILNSLLVLKKLSAKHNRKGTEVQVKIYPELPKFRLAFINQQIVLVGHYNGHTRNSNESPIMVFNSAKEWSFYSAFRALFNENWDRAENMDTHWDSLQELYKLRGIDSTIT